MLINVYNQNSASEQINNENYVLDKLNLKRYFELKFSSYLNDKDKKFVSEFEKNLTYFIENLKKSGKIQILANFVNELKEAESITPKTKKFKKIIFNNYTKYELLSTGKTKTIDDFVSEQDKKKIYGAYKEHIYKFIDFYSTVVDFFTGLVNGSGLSDSRGALKDSGGPPFVVVAGQIAEFVGLLLSAIDKEINYSSMIFPAVKSVLSDLRRLLYIQNLCILQQWNEAWKISQEIDNLDFKGDILARNWAKKGIKYYLEVIDSIYFKVLHEYQKYINSLIIGNNGTWY
ncbi:hypothetical protein [Mycoplasmopsis felifaucium]|uniref:hypothetical protein n=1 Tax=Mycoplasmopsis felifaucium TaxID=35768 RepID=UPI000489BA6A|nr:hypothetical protein [Mycoplasmopsis felifaucium]